MHVNNRFVQYDTVYIIYQICLFLQDLTAATIIQSEKIYLELSHCLV